MPLVQAIKFFDVEFAYLF